MDLSDIKRRDWVDLWLPAAARPYARLCRIDRPIGIWLTLLPCLAALVLAEQGPPEWRRLLVFSLGALIMRGAGCTANDMADRDLDRHVERTRLRPLATGELGMRHAAAFLAVQLLLAAALLPFLTPLARWLAVGVLPLVFLYPFCKRFTHWPQVVLGMAFNWGVLMAWADTQHQVPPAAVAMWLAAVCWQIGYDTIYAYVDVRDDTKLSLRSTAVRFGQDGRGWIAAFYVAAVSAWALTGLLLGLSPLYFVGILLIAAHLAWQVRRLDPEQPARNFGLFRSNLGVGIILLAASLCAT